MRQLATPLPEFNAADVGLPWNPAEVKGSVQILPCYLFTSTIFHAGDGFYFPNNNSNAVYHITAPADGSIEKAYFINDSIGWSITVRTPYILDGNNVFYDVLHTSGLVPNLDVGSIIHKGDSLAIKDKKILDPIGKWLVDIGFRNGHEQANASLPDWTGLGYFLTPAYLLKAATWRF